MKNGELRSIYPLKSIYKPNIHIKKNKIKNETVISSVGHVVIHTFIVKDVVFFE